MSDPGTSEFYAHLRQALSESQARGLFKPERVITSRQSPEVVCDDGQMRINLCANNYLGLSGRTELVDAAVASLKEFGYGMSSLRFICGT